MRYRRGMAGSGRYAHVNDIEMYYEVHGEGSPLVLLHGGLLSIDLNFAGMLPALAERHQVIAVELQGHGHTPDSDRELTIDNLADDVAALLGQLGVDRASFFGFSLGGLVSIAMADRHPELVDRLVLASVHYRHDGYLDGIREGSSDADIAARMPTQADFAEMHAAYLAVAPDPDHFEKIMAKASGMIDAFGGWSDETMAAITAPTLIVLGDLDFVRIEHASRMRDLMPNGRLAVLPGTTHAQVTGRTDWLLPMVRDFLAPVTPATAGRGR